jgi:hypothetical protein
MLVFKERKTVVSLEATDDDIEVSIHEERDWDRQQKRLLNDKTSFRISVAFVNDLSYSAIDLVATTEEEAKALAQDAVNFLKKIRPALKIVKEQVDSES